jgi:hypothetical protein
MSCTNHFISVKEKRSFGTSEFVSTTSLALEHTLNLVGELTPSGQGEMLDTVGSLLFCFLFLTSKKRGNLQEEMLILHSAVHKKWYVVQQAA